MPSCEEFEYLLCLRLDGALSASEEVFLQAHLQSCAACLALSDELSRMQRVFPLLQVEVPDTLHARMVDALQQEPAPLLVLPQKSKGSFYMRRFATTAAAFVLLISGLAIATKLSDSPFGPIPTDNPSVLSVAEDQPLAIAAPKDGAMALVPQTEVNNDSTQPTADTRRHITNDALEEAKQQDISHEAASPAPFALEQGANAPSPQVGMARSTKIDRYEAAELLLSKLYDEGKTTGSISLSQLVLESQHFIFLYTDSHDKTLSYRVSMLDGSIEGPSGVPND